MLNIKFMTCRDFRKMCFDKTKVCVDYYVINTSSGAAMFDDVFVKSMYEQFELLSCPEYVEFLKMYTGCGPEGIEIIDGCRVKEDGYIYNIAEFSAYVKCSLFTLHCCLSGKRFLYNSTYIEKELVRMLCKLPMTVDFYVDSRLRAWGLLSELQSAAKEYPETILLDGNSIPYKDFYHTYIDYADKCKPSIESELVESAKQFREYNDRLSGNVLVTLLKTTKASYTYSEFINLQTALLPHCWGELSKSGDDDQAAQCVKELHFGFIGSPFVIGKYGFVLLDQYNMPDKYPHIMLYGVNDGTLDFLEVLFIVKNPDLQDALYDFFDKYHDKLEYISYVFIVFKHSESEVFNEETDSCDAFDAIFKVMLLNVVSKNVLIGDPQDVITRALLAKYLCGMHN